MPQFSTRRRVKHGADDMFNLVADIERYPEFVPLCRSMRMRRRSRVGEREIVIAEMTIAYKMIRESFTSKVTLDRARRIILVEYLDGPFSRMENRWEFHPLVGGEPVEPGETAATVEDANSMPSGEGACVVEFFISYEFRSRTLGLLMGTMFDAAFRRFASAFEHRADAVFGRA